MNVKKLTQAVMILAASKLDLRRKLDNDMFNHIVYVSNRILLLLKKDGLDKETLERAGKYIWRLLRVVQAYNHKKRDVTIKEILDIVEEFKVIFVGG